MPFGHKLAHRLALLKGRFSRGALLALALSFVASCEKPIPLGPSSTVSQLVVSPSTATVQPNQVEDFTAVGFTTAGDTAQIAVAWSTTGGAVDTNSAGGRHYGHYHNGTCGQFSVTAKSTPGNLTASASVTVACAAPVATVTISPASVNLQSGQTSQLTATLPDANGNVLTGRTVTWSSDNGSVATVSGTGLVTAGSAGTATITATSGGKSGTASVTVSNIPVASVTVSPATASLVVGQTVQLTATPKDANGNPLLGRPVTWTTSDGTIASVSSSGLVTGVAAGGPVTITATSEGQSGTATVNVTVAPVASVTVTPATASVAMSQTVQLTATPKDANGNPLTGRAISWSSSDNTIATVNSSGLVTGVAAGSVTITATSEGKSGTASVTVTGPPVASVTVTPPSASVQAGQTVQLTATLKDANGNILTGRVVTWSSNNTSVANVNSSGLVTANTAGSATITATSEGKTGTSAITVTAVPVASVTVTPATASVPTGGTVQLTATPKDANGNPLSGRTITWQSSNSAIASVNGSGLVTGVASGGPATITATSEGQSGSAAVTVTAASATQFGHVFVVTEENTDYVDVTSSSMPYLTGLAAQYGLATQYYANTHPSIGNYFELATGQILTNDDGSSTIENVPNIVRSLLAAGKTWKSYAESIPNACYLGGDTGNYARKHNVFALLSDVANDPTGQACNIVPFTQFATDLANGTLPTFSNIVPDLCNDAHDCSLGTADSWLQTNIAPLIASPVFQQDGLLIIVFDESGGDNTLGGGRIFWTAISPSKSKRGYQSTTTYQHQSTLRLILKGLGINSFPGDAATAPDMSEFFNP